MIVNLKKPDIRIGNRIEVEGEEFILIEPQGEIKTFIEDIIDSEDSNPMIYGKQRWLVDRIEETPFSSSRIFRTHKDVSFQMGVYKKRYSMKDKEDSTTKEVVRVLNISTEYKSPYSSGIRIDNFIKLIIGEEVIEIF